VSITSYTDDFVENSFGTGSGVDIDRLIIDESWICRAGQDFPEESDRFLVELLWVTNVTGGDLIERETLI
jgi:hypothetical protein